MNGRGKKLTLLFIVTVILLSLFPLGALAEAAPQIACPHVCATAEVCTGDGATCPHAGHEADACVESVSVEEEKEEAPPIEHTVRFFATQAEVAAGAPIATVGVANGATLAADAFPGPEKLGLAQDAQVQWRMPSGEFLLPGDTVLTYETATVVDVYAEVIPAEETSPPLKEAANGSVVTADGVTLTADSNGKYQLPALGENRVWQDDAKTCYLPGHAYALDANTALKSFNFGWSRVLLKFEVTATMAKANGLPPNSIESGYYYVPQNSTVVLPGASVFGSRLGSIAVLGWTLESGGKNINFTLETDKQNEIRMYALLGTQPVPVLVDVKVTFAVAPSSSGYGTLTQGARTGLASVLVSAKKGEALGGMPGFASPVAVVKEVGGYDTSFVGWYKNNELISNKPNYDFGLFAADANITIEARFARKLATYTVTYINEMAAAGGAVPKARSYSAGARVAVDTAADCLACTGYVFVGWQDGATRYRADGAAQTFVMPAAEVKLYAVWAFEDDAFALDTGDFGKTYDGIAAGTQLTGPLAVGDEVTYTLSDGSTHSYKYGIDAPYEFASADAVDESITVTIRRLGIEPYTIKDVPAVIRPRPITFVSASADKVYDGMPLYAESVAVYDGTHDSADGLTDADLIGNSGIAAHDFSEVRFDVNPADGNGPVDRTRTNDGSAPVANSFAVGDILGPGGRPANSNFIIHTVFGTLEIMGRPVTLTAHSAGPYTANGTQYRVSGFDIEYSASDNPNRGLLPGHVLSGMSAGAGAEAAGVHPVTFSGSPVVVDPSAGNGRNLAGNYDFFTINGALVLTAPASQDNADGTPATGAPAAAATQADSPENPPPPPAAGAGDKAPAPHSDRTTPETELLERTTVPKAVVLLLNDRGWGLANLLMAVLGAGIGILLLTNLLRKPRDGEEARNKKRGLVWRVMAILTGIMVPTVFLLFENLKGPMTFVNGLTLWLAVLVALQVAGMLLLKAANRKRAGDDA